MTSPTSRYVHITEFVPSDFERGSVDVRLISNRDCWIQSIAMDRRLRLVQLMFLGKDFWDRGECELMDDFRIYRWDHTKRQPPQMLAGSLVRLGLYSDEKPKYRSIVVDGITDWRMGEYLR